MRNFLFIFLLLSMPSVYASDCQSPGVWLQVLGSGGPELDDGRASSSYLVWQDGRARVLIDIGGGAHLRFEESGAKFNDLEAILFTHLHVDHSAGFPALVKSSFFENRQRDLMVFGPSGNEYLPSTVNFVEHLISTKESAWPYLGSFLNGKGSYQLLPLSIDVEPEKPQTVLSTDSMKLQAVGVEHGPLPALAWAITLGEKTLVISGDMNGQRGTLEKLAHNADVLVAHHAISEETYGAGRNLHMPPSLIADIAQAAQPGKLILSHYMKRSLKTREESLKIISQQFKGPVLEAEDMDCFNAEQDH